MEDGVNQKTKIELKNKTKKLTKRQEKLEKEIVLLRDLIYDIKNEKTNKTKNINNRIDELEKEVCEIRETLNKLNVSVNVIEAGVLNMEKSIESIGSKQDVTIHAQDRFINQLWKAFFALLGVITLGGSTIVAMLK